MCKCKQTNHSEVCKAAGSLADKYNSRPIYTATNEDIEKDVIEFMSCLSKNVKNGHMEWTSEKKIYDTLLSIGRFYDRQHFNTVMRSLTDNKKIQRTVNYNYWVYKPV